MPAFANVSQRVGRIIEEFKIRFVENHDNVFRDARHEAVDLALRDQRAGRIIRIGDENQPRFRRNCMQHPVEVLLIIGARHFDGARAETGREQFINNKRILRGDHVTTWIQKRVAEKFDHLI